MYHIIIIICSCIFLRSSKNPPDHLLPIVMSQKAKINIIIGNVMHLAIPGANTNNSITGLHTIPHYKHSNCIVIARLYIFEVVIH